MKFSFSNIGWARHNNPDVLRRLKATGISGIEIAPTRVWTEWNGANVQSAREYRRLLGEQGFEVPALQAILFGKPQLTLFDSTKNGQTAFIDHIKYVADLAQSLGARALVYGAPKSRLRGDLSMPEAMTRAAEIFAIIGEECLARETCLCIEPNPVAYGCDFITNANDALALVERARSTGFQLHLDAAGMHLAGDASDVILPRAMPYLRHFHISEPGLTGFDNPQVSHAALFSLLRDLRYSNWMSVEVDVQKHDIGHTLEFLRRTYLIS